MRCRGLGDGAGGGASRGVVYTRKQGPRGAFTLSTRRRIPPTFQFSWVATRSCLDPTLPLCLGRGIRRVKGRVKGATPQVKGKKASMPALPGQPIPPRSFLPLLPSSPPTLPPGGKQGAGCVCVCVYACTRVCARARWCCSSVCAFGMWLVVGCVCAAHVLTRVLGVECICFALGHGVCVLCGVCVCTLVDCTFLLDYSVSMWVRSGCGCV